MKPADHSPRFDGPPARPLNLVQAPATAAASFRVLMLFLVAPIFAAPPVQTWHAKSETL